ncbi:hypothetical protein PSQ19_12990 [Devosia algicola]|uniref:Uncharacterized protein n=1 Tax=Devosia algicola TaxID=3026418 RepID=A0ABY7YK49_9HYPH|nr:hypothetical protein [Devosia algicola]WDR01661.1 hypothetical protein PSQ19_12990 [Devosia algicola]
MTDWTRGSFSVAGFAAMAVVLAGCSTAQPPVNTLPAPQRLPAVANSTVATQSLPAIGTSAAPAPGLSGQPVLGGVSSAPTQTATANDSLVCVA